MDRFLAVQAFVRVVESGSFVRAAERLEMSTSTLSRLIAELEQHLGARLLHRTTRKLSLTDSGQAFFERSVQVLSDLEEAEALAGSTAAAPRGVLRLTCSHNIALHRIAPALAAFAARYPDVKFEVSVSDRIVDLVEEGFDLAIRIGRVGSELLVARKLGSMQVVMGAAPSYLHARGTPRTLEDLQRHDLLTYAYSPMPRVWRLTDRAGHPHEVRIDSKLHANSGDMLVAAAVAGLGIVNEPDFILAPALASGQLVRVLPEYEGPRGDMWAVYPSRRHLSAKVRLFVDLIAEQFAAESGGATRVLPRRAPAAKRKRAA
jgi:DNA-binding transcriptional LysR family regulator